jgi:ribonuclease BN (tRNA processing enzyme)
VGCGDAFGSGGRWQTCVSVTTGGQHMLVDCGSTSLVAMRAQGIDPNAVDAVAITHLHGDHFGGLPFLILDGQFSKRTTPLRVLGPLGTADRLARTMEALFPGSPDVRRSFDVEVDELRPEGEAIEIGDVAVRAWAVDHASGAPALAIQVSDGRATFAYSGDTAWTPTLFRAAAGADLFAVESYTYDERVPYHLDYQTLRPHIGDLGARRTVLTHMSHSMLARLTEVDIPAAYDGLTTEL